MNCVIREGRKVLGVLGTGIDLTSFIQEVVNVPQKGVMTMFVDRQGLVQAHRDQTSSTSPASAPRCAANIPCSTCSTAMRIGGSCGR